MWAADYRRDYTLSITVVQQWSGVTVLKDRDNRESVEEDLCLSLPSTPALKSWLCSTKQDWVLYCEQKQKIIEFCFCCGCGCAVGSEKYQVITDTT